MLTIYRFWCEEREDEFFALTLSLFLTLTHWEREFSPPTVIPTWFHSPLGCYTCPEAVPG
jgi:hypothetical protein